MRRPRGFTLLELLVVVVVIGVLASIAIPTFRRTFERSYRRIAQDLLMAIYQGERAYFFANGAYQGGLDSKTSPMADWRAIHMDNPAIPRVPVSYVVNTVLCGAPPCFEAIAAHLDSTGAPDGLIMTINQNREWCRIALNNDPDNCALWPVPL